MFHTFMTKYDIFKNKKKNNFQLVDSSFVFFVKEKEFIVLRYCDEKKYDGDGFYSTQRTTWIKNTC